MKLKLSISIVIALLLALSVNVVGTRSQTPEPPYGSSVTVSCPASVTYDGSAQTPCSASYTTDDGQSGDLTVNYSGDNVNVGTVTASADYAGDADHLPSADSKPFDITPASSTVTVTCTVGAPYTYTGLEQTPCTAEATGAGMSPVDVSASLVYGNNTNAGAATADASWGGDSNHDGSSGSGGFTITPASSTVTVICAPSVTWTGSAKTPCMAGATGAGMSAVDVTASLVYGNNINPGTATADASWGGDANHTGSTGSGGFTINKAEANCTVTGYSVTYDGSSHTTTTGTCTGVNDETLSGLDLSATTHTEARSTPYNDKWTFTDVTGNYKDASGPVQDSIAKAEADCSSIIDTYIGTYNGNTYPNGTCTGAGGVDLHASLDLGTTFTNAGSGFTHWKFSGGNNYNNQENDGSVIIIPADATCPVTPYSLIYDGNPHTATGTCHGVKGETLSTLDLSATTHTDAGDYPGDAWTFTASTGNYNNTSGTVNDSIAQAAATCTITGYTGTYDGAAHGAGGSCTLGSVTLDGLDLGLTFTNWPGGTANWTFTNPNVSNSPQSLSVNIVIDKANPTCTIIGWTGNYDGSPHGASGSCIGVGGGTLSVLNLGATFTNRRSSPYTANWTFTDSTGNYNNQSGSVSITISRGPTTTTVTCLPASFTYTGNSIRPPCSARVTLTSTGAQILGPTNMPNQSGSSGSNNYNYNYSNNTNVGTATATFNYEQNGNYAGSRGDNTFTITPATATCNVTPYNVPYDGNQKQATGTCTGIGGANLTSSLVLTGTQHTNVGVYTDTWTFSNNNYTHPGGNITDTITAIAADCSSITNWTGTYDGFSHGAGADNGGNGYCRIGTNGPILHDLVSNSTFTNWPGGTATWTFTNPNVSNSPQNGSVTITINPKAASVSAVAASKAINLPDPPLTTTNSGFLAGDLPSITFGATRVAGETLGTYVITPSASGAVLSNYTVTYNPANFTIVAPFVTCTVTPYNVPYDGTPHTATGSCTDAYGVDISSGLNLGGTTHTDAGSYTDTWTFHDVTGTNDDKNGTVSDRITKINANCDDGGFFDTGVYDGTLHPNVTCTGLGGVDLSAQVTYNPNRVYVGFGFFNWTFQGGTNYNNDSGLVLVIIGQATATCTFNPYTVTYDGLPHYAIGTCTGVLGENLSASVTLSSPVTNVPGGTTRWSFSNPNYNSQTNRPVTVTILKAPTLVTVTCPASVPYTGLAQTPCSAVATGPLLNLVLPVTYGANTNAGTATASAHYAGDSNHLANDGSATFGISKATSTVTVTCPASPQPYTGSAHEPCTASYSTSDGLSGSLTPTYKDNINAGTATASADYAGDENHESSSGSATFEISKANATCQVEGYHVTYDGEAHTATGTCTGVQGEGLDGLDLSATTHTNAGSYTDTWTFHDDTGNYNDASDTVSDSIARAEATCTVNGYDVTYDGDPHTATGMCTGVKGESLSGLDLSATTHTDAGEYPTDAWTFTDVNGNYNDTSGTVSDSIARAEATCTVTAYTVTFDGSYHTATGACLGVKGETLSGLDLSATSHNLPGDYPGDAWTFTDVTGNYNNTNGTVHDSIARAEATCTVTAYTVTYDGSSHTATGSCTGVWDEILSGLDLSATTHTEAGDYPGDAWTLNNTNYTASGTVHDSIAKADATCMIIGDTRIYDGAEHGASGACTGVGGVTLTGLNLGSKHDHVPGGTAHWTFTNANYKNQSGSVSITINKAPSLVTVTCPFSVPYTGSAQKPCSALVTGAGGLNQPLTVEYNGNTNIGTATANADFAGDTDHTGSSGFKEFTITSAGVPGIPGIGAEETPTATSVPPISPANLKEDIAVGSDMKAPVLTNETQVSPALPTLSTTEVFGSDQGTASAPAEPATVGESQTPKILSTLSGSLGCIGTGFLGLLIFFMFKRRKKEDQE